MTIRDRMFREDLRGKRFGKLIVLEWAGDSKWVCECDCGGCANVLTANLKRGNTRSCGCIMRVASSQRATTHGLCGTRAYNTWLSVRRRCFDKKNGGRAYKDYGARGITMDPVWAADPVAFIEAVGQPPSDNHTLDRIDNKMGYFPGNVRWATPLEQGSNKRNNVIVTYQGERYTLAQLARKIAAECGILHPQMLSALEHEIYGRHKKRDSD